MLNLHDFQISNKQEKSRFLTGVALELLKIYYNSYKHINFQVPQIKINKNEIRKRLLVWEPDSMLILVCPSVYVMCVCVSPVFRIVNETSTEARLVPDSSSLTPACFLFLVYTRFQNIFCIFFLINCNNYLNRRHMICQSKKLSPLIETNKCHI